MGCDIHLYVEYRNPKWNGESWHNFGSETNPGRDYNVFSHLAGVRTGGETIEHPPPRGMPKDAAFAARWDNQLYVDDDHAVDDEYCSSANAESWVKGGCSEWLDAEHTKVSHPDNHTHSWLTLDEFTEALGCAEAWAKTRGYGVDAEYGALLAAMAYLAKRGHEVRIVFWFDN